MKNSKTTLDRRRTYDDAFRAEALRLALESHCTQVDTQQLGISPQPLRNPFSNCVSILCGVAKPPQFLLDHLKLRSWSSTELVEPGSSGVALPRLHHIKLPGDAVGVFEGHVLHRAHGVLLDAGVLNPARL
jgi:hypothetical protein